MFIAALFVTTTLVSSMHAETPNLRTVNSFHGSPMVVANVPDSWKPDRSHAYGSRLRIDKASVAVRGTGSDPITTVSFPIVKQNPLWYGLVEGGLHLFAAKNHR